MTSTPPDPKTRTIAYDGWPIAYQPFSPAALHLLTLLENAPQGENELVLLPGPAAHTLPSRARPIFSALADTPSARLGWEQAHLPRLAAAQGAQCLVLATFTPPLATRLPVVCYPADWGLAPPGRRPLSERLRQSLAVGGARGLDRLVWPDDLPAPRTAARLERRPPQAHPLFFEGKRAASQAGPPDPYVLYTGPQDEHNLRLLLAGWSWVSPSLGNDALLVLPRRASDHRAEIDALTTGGENTDTLRAWPLASLEELAGLYHHAAAIVHLGPLHPWGDPLAAALAAGQALVALDEPLTAARVGPAAYLVPPNQARSLGAAILTLLVEESLAGQLRMAARQRAAEWSQPRPAD